jgi:hypothetical protein
MGGYTFVAPEHELSQESIAELRAFVASRDDIRAMYWLTALYPDRDETVAQDELHIELADPPQESADDEQYRMLASVFPMPRDRKSLVWSISPVSALAEVREVGLRIA